MNKLKNKKIFSNILFILPFLILFTFLYLYGVNETWGIVGFPIGQNIFNDARVITAGSESFILGYDPLIENPAMPSGNPMNYPRIWHLLFYFGLNQSHTILLGSICFLFYLITTYLIYSQLDDLKQKFIYIFLIISPAALLGIERGNIDLIIILFVTSGALLLKKSPFISIGLISIGFVLKLFPLFAYLIIFLRRGFWDKFLKLILSTIFILFYLILTFDDLILISNATPRSGGLSYGRNVIDSAMSLSSIFKSSIFSNMTVVVSQFLSFSFILLTVITVFMGLRNKVELSNINPPFEFKSLFIAGASIYCGTFIIGNNWDYRLIFLTLTFPLLYWIVKNAVDIDYKIIGFFANLFVYFSTWSIFISKLFSQSKIMSITIFLIDEISNWALYAIFLYLLIIMIKMELSKFSKGNIE